MVKAGVLLFVKINTKLKNLFSSIKEFFLGVHLSLKFMGNLLDKRWKEFYCPSGNRQAFDSSENVQNFKRKLMYICKKSLRKHYSC